MKNKPWFIVLLSLLFLFQPLLSAGAVQVSAQPVLKIGKTEAYRGQSVTLPVVLSQGSLVKALQFDLDYNEELIRLVKIRKADIAGIELVANEAKQKVMLASPNGNFPGDEAVIVAYLDFQVLPFAPANFSEVKMFNTIIANEGASDITNQFAIDQGGITVNELEAPIITGVKNGGIYTQAVTPNVQKPADVAEVILSKDNQTVTGYSLGTAVNDHGNYFLKVVGKNGTAATAQFSIDKSVKLTGISLNLYQYILEVGESQTVLVTANYSDGSSQLLSSEALFATGSPAIAAISPDGVLNGAKEGTTYLKVSYGGFSANASVTILPRTLSSEAKLKSLVFSSGVLSPLFSPTKGNYKVSVPHAVDQLDVIAVPEDPKASLSMNGATAVSNQPYSISLAEEITKVVVKVTAENGASSSSYTIEIKRVTKELEGTQILSPVNNSTIIYNQPRISGQSEKQSKVEIFIDGVAAGSALTGLDGRWSIVSTQTLYDGPHQVIALAVDNFGNRKYSNHVNFQVDTSSTLELVTIPNAVEGDGKSTIILKAILKGKNGQGIEGENVIFSLGTNAQPSEVEQPASISNSEKKTDSSGTAFVTLTAPKINGVTPMQQIITAKVGSGDVFKENSITVMYLPASITGKVIDYEVKNGKSTPYEVKGAVVKVSEDFNRDGIIDFETTVVTGEDGSYKIYVPQGNWTYTPMISFQKKVNDQQTIPISLVQTAVTKDLTAQGEEIPSKPRMSGLILMPDPKNAGQPRPLSEIIPKDQTVETTLIAKGANPDQDQVVGDLIIAPDGSFKQEGLQEGTYDIVVKIKAPDGTELCAQTSTITVSRDAEKNGELTFQVMLVDPYGIVTDQKTGNPIQGVKMSLFYADTAFNKEKGIIPHTLVPLPVLPDFPPNNNENVQYTNVEGSYAWMVFPYSEYYIIAEKQGYQTFDSRNDTRDEDQGDSFIRNGIIRVNNSIVKYDLTMKPVSSSGGGDSDSDSRSETIVNNPPMKPEVKEGKPYIFGYEDHTFKPQYSLTRAEMASILYQIYQKGSDQVEPLPYPDVTQSHWAAEAIRFALDQGLMIGYPDGMFYPKRTITRAEMAAIAVKVRKLQTNDKTAFPDAKIHWASETIQATVEGNLMIGYPDGLFQPNRFLTRAEAVTVFNHLLGRTLSQQPEQPSFHDVKPDYWAYDQIEAGASTNVLQTYHP